MEYSTYTVVQGNGKSEKHHFASGPFPAFATAGEAVSGDCIDPIDVQYEDKP
ncbi:uncharacterized protein TrAFT101_009903 [Trichoderma asperellum]|uniref:uncharacterized protein n=1 Tax=Trichoderma asperellum TaxID=101201 RepID=UPI003321DDA1|nr:hypothetical protein TrAFT101_009903 [Trichoderma asperellum]